MGRTGPGGFCEVRVLRSSGMSHSFALFLASMYVLSHTCRANIRVAPYDTTYQRRTMTLGNAGARGTSE
eukprot:2267959-Pyramimonas_sp.AAC.1